MITYTTLGTNDLKRSGEFYDAIFEILGETRAHQNHRSIRWGPLDKPTFMIMVPWDEEPATPGNGTMIALEAQSKEQVDKVHALAIELGGKNEGDPGQRERAPHVHIAYFRDLDGNKLAIMVRLEEFGL